MLSFICHVCGSNLEFGSKVQCPACGYLPEAHYTDLEVEPEQVKEKLKKKEDFILVDVRNRDERDLAKVEGSIWISLHDLPDRLDLLDNKKEIIAYCHAGRRSMVAAKFLQQKDFNAKSMAGGIDAWSLRIDPKVKRY